MRQLLGVFLHLLKEVCPCSGGGRSNALFVYDNIGDVQHQPADWMFATLRQFPHGERSVGAFFADPRSKDMDLLCFVLFQANSCGLH
jgi:hypothetical protein